MDTRKSKATLNPVMFRFYLRRKYDNSADFAKEMSVSEGAVVAWGTGEKQPDSEQLKKIATVLGVLLSDLQISTRRFIRDAWHDQLLDYFEDPSRSRLTNQDAIRLSKLLGISGDLDAPNQDKRYRLSDTKIKKAVKMVSIGVPESRLYAGLGVSRLTVIRWLKEGEAVVDTGAEPKDESERLVRDFFLKVRKASVESEMKDLEILEKHRKKGEPNCA